MSGVAALWRPAGPFVHPAFFYRGDDEYLAGLVPFVEEGLKRGQPVAAAVPADRLAVLRDGLGAAAAEVLLVDMSEAGRNPARIIPAVLSAFADEYGRQPVRIIGEPIWPSRSDVEYPPCAQHEALINMAFSGRDMTIVCPYDIDGLDSQAIDDACATHPVVWDAAGQHVSDLYAPAKVVERYNEPLTAGPDAVEFTVRTPLDVTEARRFAARHGQRLGLSPVLVPDIEYVVTELATNSLLHAKSECQLSIWRDGDALVCLARDTGELMDPLVGRRVPPPDVPGGRGLLLINYYADLVRVHTGPAGTAIEVRLAVDERSHVV
jgi:anti-sigma regulatory factor (Ser/Thr protein kinase)